MTTASDRDERIGDAKDAASSARHAIWNRLSSGFRRFEDIASLRSSLGAWFADQLEIEQRARSAFHLVPIGLMVGVALVYGAGWAPSPFAVLILLGAALLCFWRFSARPISRACATLLVFAAAGSGLALWETDRANTTIFSGEATVRITGTVLSREQDERGRYRYIVGIHGTEKPILSRPPEQVRLVVGSRHAPLAIGDVYSGLIRMRPPSGPAYPGGYDFAFNPFFDGLGAYGFSLGAPDPNAAVPDDRQLSLATRFQRLLRAVRVEMTARIRDAIGGAEGAIAAALITGERAGIPDDATEWLRNTGLAHVLSISGLHMAIVAGFTMLIVRSGLSLIPGIALRVPAKKIAAVAALAVSTFYLSLSGADVAPQRSYIMLAIMLLAVVFDRPALTLRNVSLAAIIVIAVAPHSVMTASFQMSFAATVALVGCYQLITRRLPKRVRGQDGGIRKLAIALCAAAATSLLAGSATGPYAAYHFHRFAMYGFVANVATMPLFSFWIMPLALIGSLLIPLGLEAWPLQLMGHGIGAVLLIARYIDSWLPVQTIGQTTALGLLLMTAGILAAACFASRLRWVAAPLLLSGAILAPHRETTPSLLIFEDGKEIATIDADRNMAYRRERPSGFVADQWERAFAANTDGQAADERTRQQIPMRCVENVCTFETSDGLTVVWTDDYEKTGIACDTADVAIVARAIHQTHCRSGAALVTLRTLRRSGSLAIRRDPVTNDALVATAISPSPRKWNLHRLAPWPEYWKKPEEPVASVSQSGPTELTLQKDTVPSDAVELGNKQENPSEPQPDRAVQAVDAQ